MENQETQCDVEYTAHLETTVGELVEVITAIAQKAGRSQEECYKLASFTVEKLLRDKKRKELLS
jgi:hypothetical protein